MREPRVPVEAMEGVGVFETMRTYAGAVFALDEHLDRLWASARGLGLALPVSRRALTSRLVRTARRATRRDQMLRVTVLPGGRRAQLRCLAQPVRRYPASWYAQGMDLRTVPTARTSVAASDPQAKHAHRLSSILARLDDPSTDAWEVVRCDAQGYVAEATTANLCIVRQGGVLTPALWQGVLEGITRRHVLRLARELGLSVQERPLTRHEIYNAEECFVTNTSVEVLPVRRLDGRRIGRACPGPVTRRLQQAWRARVEGLVHG